MLVTDIEMPGMTGLEMLELVRADARHAALPILMLTTEGLAAKKEQGKAAGATGWIIKPFDPEKLLQTIAKVLP